VSIAPTFELSLVFMAESESERRQHFAQRESSADNFSMGSPSGSQLAHEATGEAICVCQATLHETTTSCVFSIPEKTLRILG